MRPTRPSGGSWQKPESGQTSSSYHVETQLKMPHVVALSLSLRTGLESGVRFSLHQILNTGVPPGVPFSQLTSFSRGHHSPRSRDGPDSWLSLELVARGSVSGGDRELSVQRVASVWKLPTGVVPPDDSAPRDSSSSLCASSISCKGGETQLQALMGLLPGSALVLGDNTRPWKK